MAITNRKTGNITHQGLVLKTGICRTDRVMSDIYADQWYALVWDAEAGKAKEELTCSSFELCTADYAAEVDATPEVRAAYEGRLERLEAAKRAAERAQAERERRLRHDTPGLGKRMKVVRSYRQAPKGVVGEVFWVRGKRVGLRTSDRKENGRWADVVWCNASQLQNTEPYKGMTARS